jgi:hypothetical protein
MNIPPAIAIVPNKISEELPNAPCTSERSGINQFANVPCGVSANWVVHS